VSEAESGEVNFCKAETLDEFPSTSTSDDHRDLDDSDSAAVTSFEHLAKHDPLSFTSTIRFATRTYNKYRPHHTGLYDDPLFVNYEYRTFMRNGGRRCIPGSLNLSELSQFNEDELCSKYENINIERTVGGQAESASSTSESANRFRALIPSLADLPVNILEQMSENIFQVKSVDETDVKKPAGFSFMKRQKSSLTSLAASVFSQMSQGSKTKTLKRSKAKFVLPPPGQQLHLIDDNETVIARTPSSRVKASGNGKLTSTSKKRNLNTLSVVDGSAVKPHGEQLGEWTDKTPKAKKRLIALDSHNDCALVGTSSPATPSRTILHYFSSARTNAQ
jgi:hypothetical protein